MLYAIQPCGIHRYVPVSFAKCSAAVCTRQLCSQCQMERLDKMCAYPYFSRLPCVPTQDHRQILRWRVCVQQYQWELGTWCLDIDTRISVAERRWLLSFSYMKSFSTCIFDTIPDKSLYCERQFFGRWFFFCCCKLNWSKNATATPLLACVIANVYFVPFMHMKHHPFDLYWDESKKCRKNRLNMIDNWKNSSTDHDTYTHRAWE